MRIKDIGRALWLPLAAFAGTVPLVVVRAAATGVWLYGFLLWNLFLACVPYLIARAQAALAARARAASAPARWAGGLALAAAAFAWLVFYPNAPYIFTDFIHVVEGGWLRRDGSRLVGPNALLWYDILMSAAFAFAGHLAGLASIRLEFKALAHAWGRTAATTIITFAVIASGFGIYLGRFVRLNSWDLVADPLGTASAVMRAFADPKAVLFALASSFFVGSSYLVVAAFRRVD